jgi:hypothetical protein
MRRRIRKVENESAQMYEAIGKCIVMSIALND